LTILSLENSLGVRHFEHNHSASPNALSNAILTPPHNARCPSFFQNAAIRRKLPLIGDGGVRGVAPSPLLLKWREKSASPRRSFNAHTNDDACTVHINDDGQLDAGVITTFGVGADARTLTHAADVDVVVDGGEPALTSPSRLLVARRRRH
jgi:hypothetical protein